MNGTILTIEGPKRNYELIETKTSPYFRWLSISKRTGKAKEMPVLRRKINRFTYLLVSAGSDRFYLQKLVWEAYNGPVEEENTINFKDGNRQNCRIENLEVENISEKYRNMINKTRENTANFSSYKKIRCLENNQVFKGTGEVIKWLRNHKKIKGNDDTIKSCIYDVVKGRQKTAYGYTFRYVGKGNKSK